MAPHTCSATPEQIDTLLNFLDEHRDLARGRLRSVKGKRLWGELCNVLNSMGGCTKTVQQWQNVGIFFYWDVHEENYQCSKSYLALSYLCKEDPWAGRWAVQSPLSQYSI